MALFALSLREVLRVRNVSHLMSLPSHRLARNGWKEGIDVNEWRE